MNAKLQACIYSPFKRGTLKRETVTHDSTAALECDMVVMMSPSHHGELVADPAFPTSGLVASQRITKGIISRYALTHP